MSFVPGVGPSTFVPLIRGSHVALNPWAGAECLIADHAVQVVCFDVWCGAYGEKNNEYIVGHFTLHCMSNRKVWQIIYNSVSP